MFKKRVRKITDEYLIFAKNIPRHMSDRTIELFESYNPTGFRNIYPHSSMTTIVFSFSNQIDADTAQREMDQMRLDHVILKVERHKNYPSMQSKRSGQEDFQSSCFLEKSYKTGSGDELLEDSRHSGSSVSDHQLFTDIEPVQNPATAGDNTTWANIAAYNVPPGLAVSFSVRSSELITDLGNAPCKTITTPIKPLSNSLSQDQTVTDTPVSNATYTTTKPVRPMNPAHNAHIYKTKDESSHVARAYGFENVIIRPVYYIPPDTTEYIREKHEQKCFFCQYRIARQTRDP